MTASILVVDDLEPNIKLLEAKLLSEYYTVFTANSGKRAIEILAEQKIDVVLLDVMMPDMDGFETCQQIKSNPDTTHIPVIMVTALTDIEDRVKGLKAGADEFLTKPINDVPLFARVKSLARMKAMIDELKLRNKTNQELGAAIASIEDNFTNNKILLINDDVVQARHLIKYLSALTFDVRVIARSEEILAFGSYIPDLVIISCQLDKEDPLRICVTLKSKEDYSHVILMMSTEEENLPMVIKGMELGVNDYFLNPVDENELLARIRTQLRRKKYQDNLRTSLEQSVNFSIKDGLTEVFNRHYFDIHITQMIKQSAESKTPLCLMMLDIDHFKQVNDTYGHQAGDAVLKFFAAELKNGLRVTDLIARYGGEEFAVLLNNTTIAEGEVIAQRVRRRIEEFNFVLPLSKEVLKKTTSIGITAYNFTEPQEEFLARADKALYKAKDNNRNKVVTL